MLIDYFNQRKSCFTENYLVFSLNEKMPQITEIYMEKEEDLLDFGRTITFDNRNKNDALKPRQHSSTVYMKRNKRDSLTEKQRLYSF